MEQNQTVKFENIEDFSKLLHLTEEGVSRLLWENNYRTFKMKKRNGKYREINAPKIKLKVIQKWILINILEKIEISSKAMAFVKNKNGIKLNALTHKDNKYILALDLKDFYPSITQKSIYELFKNLGYSQNASEILSTFCSYKGKLPQGGITSPIISNIIANNLDIHLESYCNKHNITYTRYADDLTFSSNDKKVLINTEKIIRPFILNSGFIINTEKTRFLSPISHKKVTGITINNNELKASKSIKRKIRSIIYYSIKTGMFIEEKSKEKLIGNIAFISSIEDNYLEYCIKYINYVLNKLHKKNDLGLLAVLKKIKTMSEKYSQKFKFSSIVNYYTFKELMQFPIVISNYEKEEFEQNRFRKNKNRNFKYRVSNLGNIEILEDNKNKYESAEIIDSPEKGVGWPVLKKYPTVFVYNLVAETWLEKPAGEGWTVHHINNNGYDNRPENLIYLKSEIHNKLPKIKP